MMKKTAENMTWTENLILSMDRPGLPTVITGFLEFDRPLDFGRVVRVVEKRLLSYEKFKQRVIPPALKTGRYRWEKYLRFDLGEHLLRFPVSGESPQSLERHFSEWVTAPLDMSRPPWRIHCIEHPETRRTILFFRIHHCIADGIALARLLGTIASTEPEDCDRDDPAGASPEKPYRVAPESNRPRFRAVLPAPGSIGDTVIRAASALSDISARTARLLLLPPDSRYFVAGREQVPGCRTTGRQTGEPRRLAWFKTPLSLDEVKDAGGRFNATVNDIVMAGAAGGLRRYLEQCHGLGVQTGIRMIMPVNIRPQRGPVRLKNEFGFVPVTLPVYIRDPGRRIRRIHDMLDRLKRSSDATVTWLGLNLLGGLPPGFARKTAHLFTGKITGAISNVPGPGRPLYFAGGRLNRVMFWVPLLSGLTVGISIISYNNAVSMGIVTDPRVIPDPGIIVGHMEAEFREILEWHGKRGG